MITVKELHKAIEKSNDDVVRFLVLIACTTQLIEEREFLNLIDAVKYTETHTSCDRFSEIHYVYYDGENKKDGLLASITYNSDGRFKGYTYSYKNKNLFKTLLEMETKNETQNC